MDGDGWWSIGKKVITYLLVAVAVIAALSYGFLMRGAETAEGITAERVKHGAIALAFAATLLSVPVQVYSALTREE